MEKDYIDVPIEHEAAAMNLIKNQTKEFFKLIQDKVGELVWEVANNYLESHMEGDVIVNYKDSVKNEIVRRSYFWCKDPKSFGEGIRQTIFEEHKEEILPLIRNEQIVALEKEVERLKADLIKADLRAVAEARNYRY